MLNPAILVQGSQLHLDTLQPRSLALAAETWPWNWKESGMIWGFILENPMRMVVLVWSSQIKLGVDFMEKAMKVDDFLGLPLFQDTSICWWFFSTWQETYQKHILHFFWKERHYWADQNQCHIEAGPPPTRKPYKENLDDFKAMQVQQTGESSAHGVENCIKLWTILLF